MPNARKIRLNNVKYNPETNAIEFEGAVNKQITSPLTLTASDILTNIPSSTGPLATAILSAIENFAYSVNDILTLDGGVDGQIKVLSIGEGIGDIVSVSVNNPGINYQVNDILTIHWPAEGGQVKVLTVGGGGELETLEVITPSSGYHAQTIYNVGLDGSITGGSGEGGTINIFSNPDRPIATYELISLGSGYSDTVEQSVSGGTGANAHFDITVTVGYKTVQDVLNELI